MKERNSGIERDVQRYMERKKIEQTVQNQIIDLGSVADPLSRLPCWTSSSLSRSTVKFERNLSMPKHVSVNYIQKWNSYNRRTSLLMRFSSSSYLIDFTTPETDAPLSGNLNIVIKMLRRNGMRSKSPLNKSFRSWQPKIKLVINW